jgi:DNA (cytosine-5)-methyltransferase 1
MNSNSTRAITLGEHRGSPRIYLQGKYLLSAGFSAGQRISATFESGRVTLSLDDDGERKVSSKRKGEVPVVDINSSQLREAFGDCRNLVVRLRGDSITIEATRTEKKQRTRCRNGKEGALFSGGGLLSEAARQAGFKTAWACEIEELYADTFSANHPDTHVFNCSVSELEISDLEPVEMLTAGIPCQPFSAKRQGRKGAVPEAHPLGDMVFWTLRIIDAMNPATVVIEQVPRFLDSGAGQVLIHSLERMGYDVESRIIDPAKSGELCGRTRAVVVATSNGEKFTWPEEKPSEMTLGDLLEDVATDSSEWFTSETKPWLFNHWEKQRARGNNFISAQLDADSKRVPAITKRYFAGQGDGAVVKHPTQPGTFRWLRVSEVARLMGLPDGYVLPSAKTRAGEILGQAVHVKQFTRLLGSIAA